MFDDAHVMCALGGFLVLAHACYAVISYRDELKIAGDEFEGVPVQVAVECAIGAAMCAWGALGFAGEFMPIAAHRSFDRHHARFRLRAVPRWLNVTKSPIFSRLSGGSSRGCAATRLLGTLCLSPPVFARRRVIIPSRYPLYERNDTP